MPTDSPIIEICRDIAAISATIFTTKRALPKPPRLEKLAKRFRKFILLGTIAF
jgi:hypothetical protein